MSYNALPLSDWLVCPKCGSKDTTYIPPVLPERNTFFNCSNCGQEGVIIG